MKRTAHLALLVVPAFALFVSLGCSGTGGGDDDAGDEDFEGEQDFEGVSWTLGIHPCEGNRTDTLLVETAKKAWVGCGTTNPGYGVFSTEDGGKTWSSPTTSPTNYFDEYRATSLQLIDGWLYVGGMRSGGSETVVRFDTGAATAKVETVFEAGDQLWNGFTVGTYHENSAGVAFAESLTGYDSAIRTEPEGEWASGDRIWGGGDRFQILEVSLHDDLFYGSGATIAQPPMVFVPPEGAKGDDVAFEAVVLSEQYEGEMWSIEADNFGITTGGVDQDFDRGMIYSTSGSGLSAADWTEFDVGAMFPDAKSTWVHGVCRRGGLIVAAAEDTWEQKGLILVSDDDGETFTDITPDDDGPIQPVSRCQVLGNGTIVVAGAFGWFGVARP